MPIGVPIKFGQVEKRRRASVRLMCSGKGRRSFRRCGAARGLPGFALANSPRERKEQTDGSFQNQPRLFKIVYARKMSSLLLYFYES